MNVPNFNFGAPATPNYSQFDFGSLLNNNSQINAPTNMTQSLQGSMPSFDFSGGQTQSPGMFSNQSMFGGANNTGWLTGGLGAATGLAQSWLGFENLGLAKDQFNFQKDAYQEQFSMQKEEYDRRRSERDARINNASSAGL